jgi:hypothetical protein
LTAQELLVSSQLPDAVWPATITLNPTPQERIDETT